VRRILLFLFALSLAIEGHLRAAVEIPCEYRQGLVWVSVRSPERAEPWNFLLDSGAGASVLDVSAARAMGCPLGSVRTVRGVGGRAAAYDVAGLKLCASGVALPSPRLALDLSALSRACGRRVDGLIGADFFQARIVQVDFGAQKLRLLTPAELPRTAVALPLALRGDAWCVRASINSGKDGWARVDTGCDTAVEWVTTARSTQSTAGTSIAAAAGSSEAVPATLQLGPLRMAEMPTGFRTTPIFAGESGLLGNRLLERFTVTFDVAKKRLFLGAR
jgi:hypothetical protein